MIRLRMVFGVGGDVKHLSFSNLAKFMDARQSNCEIGQFKYGRYYKGLVDCFGMEKIVTIKNWQLSFPPHEIYALYPAMLYNAIVLTRHDQSKRRPNVARLIGYSIDRILSVVYDLSPRCTLYNALFGSDDFEWKYRVKAAIGIGRAIESFHEDDMIVGSLNSNFLLVDEEFNVHLCDIRLQPFVEAMVPKERSSVAYFVYEGYGARAPECGRPLYDGYHAPEDGKFVATFERDVYSYGILLLELISKGEMVDPQCDSDNLVDKSFIEVEESEGKKITSLALSCLTVDPAKRPKIKDVVSCLESLTKDHFSHRDKILKV